VSKAVRIQNIKKLLKSSYSGPVAHAYISYRLKAGNISGQSPASLKNSSYLYHDHNLNSTRGGGFQLNSIDERLWVVDIASGEMSKAIRNWHHVKDLSLIKPYTGLELERLLYPL